MIGDFYLVDAVELEGIAKLALYPFGGTFSEESVVPCTRKVGYSGACTFV